MKKLILVALLIMGTAGMAQEKMQPLVSVTGEGKVKAVPDEVTVRVRVETTGKEAAAVKTENDKNVDAVLKFAVKMDIPQNNVTTQYINLDKSYDYQTKTYSYQANQSIAIKIEDLSRYEEIMSGLIASGINNIDGIEFSSSKIDSYRSEARKKAVADAKMKANEYAGVLNQSAGKALSISETGISIPMPQPQYKVMAMRASDSMESSQETIAPGEMTITARVSVTFELL